MKLLPTVPPKRSTLPHKPYECFWWTAFVLPDQQLLKVFFLNLITIIFSVDGPSLVSVFFLSPLFLLLCFSFHLQDSKARGLSAFVPSFPAS